VKKLKKQVVIVSSTTSLSLKRPPTRSNSLGVTPFTLRVRSSA